MDAGRRTADVPVGRPGPVLPKVRTRSLVMYLFSFHRLFLREVHSESFSLHLFFIPPLIKGPWWKRYRHWDEGWDMSRDRLRAEGYLPGGWEPVSPACNLTTCGLNGKGREKRSDPSVKTVDRFTEFGHRLTRMERTDRLMEPSGSGLRISVDDTNEATLSRDDDVQEQSPCT
ncbi:hypothetical protein BDP81DRAFT_421772 [Colletotrichum phormii]|uniref:Uncharacterized protein n=1 Tax=Colletotrichum phormii TaxID=359342 RepID=A0AAJ0EI81_9PEZI|nr:uncharacterized protein BDP81DRAFT_421772 [Colletotrichum phormii]KAK1639744.1 hypothetical protein BDP81DRAFT_421772 [Colletotrichum phormii]